MKNIIFHSIDSPKRDLEWRLVLALILKKNFGFSSLIAPTRFLHVFNRYTKRSIYLGRLGGNSGRSNFDTQMIDRMKKQDCRLLFLHDEGAFFEKSDYTDTVHRIYPIQLLSIEIVKKFYFWGEYQYRHISSDIDKQVMHKVDVVGHPRFELSKPKYAFLDIKQSEGSDGKWSPRVLICTRFALANTISDDPSGLSKRMLEIRKEGRYRSTDRTLIDQMFSIWSKTVRDMASFVEIIKDVILDNPEVDFLIRPHPAEDSGFYSEAFGHFHNVTVSGSGDVRRAIRESDLVIQSECTTGLESLLSDVPTINIVTASTKKYGVIGLDEIGIRASNSNEITKILKNLSIKIDSPFPSSDESLISLKKHLYNVDNDKDIFEKIASDIASINGSESNNLNFSATSKWWFSMEMLKLRAIYSIRNLQNLFKRKQRKYGGFDTESVLTLWERIGGARSDVIIKKHFIWIK